MRRFDADTVENGHIYSSTRRSKIVSRASAMCVEHLLRATVPKIAFVIYTC